MEEGSGSGQDPWTATTPEDHEEAHFFAFVAHNMKENGHDRSRWNRPDPRTPEPQRTAEDRQPTALVPAVQITAHRLLGLLRRGEQTCT